MRYFRATPAVYADICAQLDAAYGYPNAETKTLRTLPLAADLPTDAEGLVYLMISAEYCDFILPGQLLPELLASGSVEEVTKAEHESLVPAITP